MSSLGPVGLAWPCRGAQLTTLLCPLRAGAGTGKSHVVYGPPFLTLLCLAGTCLRLYAESFYDQSLPPLPPAGVTEANLSRLVLLLKRLDIADMGQCDFLDRPGVWPCLPWWGAWG